MSAICTRMMADNRHTTAVSRDFLLRLIKKVPCKIHTVLTDNGIRFTTPGAGGSAVPLIREAMASGELFRAHAFEYACARNDIEHRTTKARHPWTNGQVERMNRTIKTEPPRVYRRVCGSMIRLLFRQRSSLRRRPPLLRSA